MSHLIKHDSGQIAEDFEVASLNDRSVLPPISNLPQWTRNQNLDKNRYPKVVVKNSMQSTNSDSSSKQPLEGYDNSGSDIVSNESQRIQHLEKSIVFLKEQHREILENLHDEIDNLKRENKELHFRVVVYQKQSRANSAMSKHSQDFKQKSESAVSRQMYSSSPQGDASRTSQATSEEKFDELKLIFLEEEVKELRKQIKSEKAKNQSLIALLDVQKTEAIKPTAHGGREGVVPAQFAHIEGSNVMPQSLLTPSQEEYEAIIQQLKRTVEKQAHELQQLKSDLSDVLYSHKWTPDAYLLAKAYIADEEPQSNLPRLRLRASTKKLYPLAHDVSLEPLYCRPASAYVTHDSTLLPALKQTMGNKASDRRKRLQILQKTRTNREILN